MRLAAMVIELIGIAAAGMGIGIEIVYEADLGFITLTTGSLMLAAGAFIYAKCIPRTK